jgi:hypothetical protein
MNRESDYANAVLRGEHMKLGFLQHSLMISRMHFMLEMASRDPGNQVEVTAWRQGAELHGNKVRVPEIRSYRVHSGAQRRTDAARGERAKLPIATPASFA